MSELDLSQAEIDHLFTPAAIREKAARIFALTEKGQTAFRYHPEKLQPTVDYVLQVIRKNYPDLDIPFHSRWGHFRAGSIDRVKGLNSRLTDIEPLERARLKLDLVITSVLLDAGAGTKWSYLEQETKKVFARSEGLGVASWHMFFAGAMSSDGKSARADSKGLKSVSAADLEKHFQVSSSNPLVGVDGRRALLNNLARAVENKEMFKDARPGNIVDHMIAKHGRSFAAPELLRAVLEGFGSIWPGRLSARGKNLGDVWKYSKLIGPRPVDSLVPIHKLSQWMTYSLIEPILEAGIEIHGVENLTGLAEYRNGGLLIDSGLISLNDPALASRAWRPESELVIEWRALTVQLLDRIGERVREALGKSPQEFPLAKALEGGTWWAGRFLALEKRDGGGPPLQIESDGTVF